MPRTLYTLAYPTLASVDRETIEAFRRQHDLPNRDVVAAHFTLVFASHELDQSRYVAHIKDVASAWQPVSFVCRHAMLGVDNESGSGHAYLVPDEGFSDISLLHDRLYTGPLAASLRLDLPFIPHITIGTLPDLNTAKALCDQLNAEGVSIAGTVDALTVCALERNRIEDLKRIALG